MGAASLLNILFGLVRMKAAAVLLGPAGVGLFGLYQHLVATASTAAALGFGTVGTRQVAEANAKGNEDEVAAARRALFWGSLGLAALGSSVFFLLRGPIARNILADPLHTTDVGWLAIGVALTVLAGSQTALLNGLRRVGDLARIQVTSGIMALVLGIGALLLWRQDGMVVLIIVGPMTSFVMGHWYVSKLRPIGTGPTPLRVLTGQLRMMALLGLAFMVSSLVTSLGNLAVRTLVQRELGLDALGQFQAAWMIGMTYLSFVLGAMATDYYPRLTGCIHDKAAACRLINEQTEICLLLAGPVLIALLALCPWVIQLLYSAEFTPAVAILRWQLLGDIFKLLSWPLGFALLAAGAGKTFVLTETTGIGVFVLGVAVGLPIFGLVATGVAFLALYLAYLPLVYWFGYRRLGFFWTREVKQQTVILIVGASIVAALGAWSDTAAAVLGMALALGFAAQSLARIGSMTEMQGRMGRVAAMCRRVIEKLGQAK